MKLQSIDLNLLVGFEALLIEGSVSGAARRMGLSQSAMSNVLARLRGTFGDPLFQREGQHMVPTTRARQLADAVGDALNSIRKAIGNGAPFDASQADVQFTIATTDCAEVVVLPRLLQTIKRHAPNVALHIKPLRTIFGVPAAELDTCDFALGFFPLPLPPGSGLNGTVLFDQKLVGVINKRHALARRRLGMRQFLSLEHISTNYSEKDAGLIPDAVAKLGHRPKVGLLVPHLMAVPFLAARSEMLGIVPLRLARALSAPLGLRIVELPLQVRTMTVSLSLVWHQRHQHNDAHRWFREFVVQNTQH